MNNPIFSQLRKPRAPESLKQIVLTSCAEAVPERVQSDPTGTHNWFDLILQAATVVTVVLFALTCFSSFVSDNIPIPTARFSRLDVNNSNLSSKSGKSSSFIVMRRRQSWL